MVDVLVSRAFCHPAKFLVVCRLLAQEKNEMILNGMYLSEVLQFLLCLELAFISMQIYILSRLE